MKKRYTIAIFLFLLLTTITFKDKIIIEKFNIKKIIIENNFLTDDNELNNLLIPVYNKSLINLDNSEFCKKFKKVSEFKKSTNFFIEFGKLL